MRCSICGAKLKKEGDICTNCYKMLKEQETLDKDTKVLHEIHRKYGISYELTKYTWIIIIFILSTILCFASGSILGGIASVFLMAVLIGFLLFLDKRLALATKAVFYETKVTYTFRFLFFNTEKTVKYSDIKDMKSYKTLAQRKYGYGDLCIYAQGAFPGATLFNGFQIKNIEDIDEEINRITLLIGNAVMEE